MSDLVLNSDAILTCVFDGNGGARSIDLNKIADWKPENGTLWVHLNYQNDEHIDWLNVSSKLDPLIVDALIAEDTRPRSVAIGDGLLIILRGINLNPGEEPDDMISLRLWIDKHRVISTRIRELFSIRDVVDQLNSGKGPFRSAEFLVELSDRLVSRMSETVENFEERIDSIEEAIMEEDNDPPDNDLALLRRQTISIRRYLAPERAGLTRITREKISWLSDDNRLQLSEISDRLIRLIEDIDAVRERTVIAQEELQRGLSEQINKRMYVLSIFAAIFLPLGFLTGLLGVNIAGIPGIDYQWAFLIFVGILIIVSGIQLVIFRWKKWM